MSQYTLYTYQFAPIFNFEQKDLFGDIYIPSPIYAMEHKNETLKELIYSDITFKHGNKHLSIYHIKSDEDMIVFKIANKKNVILEKNFKSTIYINEPSVFVVIYNNSKMQRIAIEQNSSVFTDTETVAKIIQRSLQPYLKNKNLSISIKREYQELEFWDTIDKFNGKLKMIRFQFEYPNLPRARSKVSEMIKELSIETNSTQSKVELNSNNDEILCVSKDNEYINDLVNASANSGNNIIFKAAKVKTYTRIGDTVKTVILEDVELTDLDKLKEILASDGL